MIDLKRAVANTVQSLLQSFGYELRKCGRKKAQYADKFSLQRIFDYFPSWQTKLRINGKWYGGKADYATERISILNVPLLFEHLNFTGKTVLELGPLEGGNSVKLSDLGVKRITAVEGRVENYIKCCVSKNLFGLENTTFYLDDVRNISPEKYGTFDIALVAGILYHLDDPYFLLRKLSMVAENLVISTHYADETSPSPKAQVRTLSTESGAYKGKIFKEGSIWDVCAGLQNESLWLFEKDLISMCRAVGYRDVQVLLKNPVPSEAYKLIYLVTKK